MYLQPTYLPGTNRAAKEPARAPLLGFLRLRQEKSRRVTPAMHEKLSNTMAKLEAAPDTVTKDLRYKFAAPIPRSRPTRRAADAGRYRRIGTGQRVRGGIF